MNFQVINQCILDTINLARNETLSIIEQELAINPRWPVIRSKLLKTFGDRGLYGRVQELLKIDIHSQSDFQTASHLNNIT